MGKRIIVRTPDIQPRISLDPIFPILNDFFERYSISRNISPSEDVLKAIDEWVTCLYDDGDEEYCFHCLIGKHQDWILRKEILGVSDDNACLCSLMEIIWYEEPERKQSLDALDSRYRLPGNFGG